MISKSRSLRVFHQLCRLGRCGLLVCTLLAAGPLRAERVRVVDRVIAVIEEGIILRSDLDGRIAPLLEQLKQIPDATMRKQKLAELQRQALDHMIGEKLIAHEARKLKIEITDKEIERAVADVMQRNNLTREQLEEALRREGKSLDAYKRQILRPQLLRLKVLNSTVRARVSVSEEELRAAYQKNMRELGVETKVRARHIFVMLPDHPSDAQVAERKRFAESLLAQIKKGKAFDELARKHSDDSVTRTDGGDLGFFGRGTLPANVENVVFQMKKGEVSKPLRTSRGFHLIELTDRKESEARPYEDVRRELKQQLQEEKQQRATEAWLRELRKKAHVEIKL